jgi:hypothetical protein
MSAAAPTAPPGRGWVRRERSTLVVIGVLAVAVATLAVTLVVRTADERPRARVGDVFLAQQTDEESDTTEVLVPWARLEVAVGDPVSELPGSNDDTEALVRPPDGGSFVRVDVRTADDAAQIPLAAMSSPFVGSAEVVLTADGRDYPVTDRGLDLRASAEVTTFGGTAWVAVEGEPTDLSVAVTVDGQTQVVAGGKVEPGRAAELDDLPTPEELRDRSAARCGAPVESRTDGLTIRTMEYVRCQRKLALRVPYVDGLGWAAEGRDFLVVQVAADHRSLDFTTGSGDATTFWRIRDPELVVTLDGADSIGTADVNALDVGLFGVDDPQDPVQHVFDVPSDASADELELTLRLTAVPYDPFDTESRDVLLRWSVPSGDTA